MQPKIWLEQYETRWVRMYSLKMLKYEILFRSLPKFQIMLKSIYQTAFTTKGDDFHINKKISSTSNMKNTKLLESRHVYFIIQSLSRLHKRVHSLVPRPTANHMLSF